LAKEDFVAAAMTDQCLAAQAFNGKKMDLRVTNDENTLLSLPKSQPRKAKNPENINHTAKKTALSNDKINYILIQK
jgi:hypothetical protein